MANGENTFWMVWTKRGTQPRFTHSRFSAAQQEAERLAKKHPGERFFVLEAVGSYKVELPKLEWTPTGPPAPSEAEGTVPTQVRVTCTCS